jgi:hypothetical protein
MKKESIILNPYRTIIIYGDPEYPWDCTSSNGLGQIVSKTKGGFQYPYKPFLPFQQCATSASSGHNRLFLGL